MRTMTLAAASMAVVGSIFAVAIPLRAGPERITFPAGFDTSFTLYNTVDRIDRNRVLFMYVSPQSDEAAVPGEAAPNGTVLVMADKAARMNPDGTPMFDADGRLIPEGDFATLLVMEKQPGWGEEQPPNLRNGDWDYAVFAPDGTLNTEVNYDSCFTCHLNRTGRDFTFTYFKNVSDRGR